MKITINALTPEAKSVRVVIDTEDPRHLIRDGQEVELTDLSHYEQRRADTLLDALYDIPMYHDGRIWGAHYTVTSLNAWQPASLEEDRHE